MPIDPSTLDPNNPALWAAPVPSGEVRSLVNQPSSAGGLGAVGIATTVIATLCVVARLFTRIYVVRNVGADDCELEQPIQLGVYLTLADLILISLALALAYIGAIEACECYSCCEGHIRDTDESAAVPLGAGNHIWDVPVQNFMDFMKVKPYFLLHLLRSHTDGNSTN